MTRNYAYVGPKAVRDGVAGDPHGHAVASTADLAAWFEAEPERAGGRAVATYVVMASNGELRVASQRSEHVAYAGGLDVVAAGELVVVAEPICRVTEITNQSTGYCPDTNCWSAVSSALRQAGVAHPEAFTLQFVFRRCPACGERNLVKDNWFVCALCEAELPREWNF